MRENWDRYHADGSVHRAIYYSRDHVVSDENGRFSLQMFPYDDYTITLYPSEDSDFGVTLVEGFAIEESGSADFVLTGCGKITASPSDALACEGSSHTFSVTASGEVTGYQWQKDGIPIEGANQAHLTIDRVDQGHAGTYNCLVTFACLGERASNPATLAVVQPVTITSHPQSLHLIAGEAASFSVSAEGSDPLRFQWEKNGIPIAGAIQSELILPSVSLADEGTYTCEISNPCDSITSGQATLTLNRPPVLTGPETMTTPEEQPLTITLADITYEDPDSEASELTLKVDPGENYSVAGTTITPVRDYNGELLVGLSLADKMESGPVFTTTVTVTPVNDIPVITGQDFLEVESGTSFALGLQHLTASDPDNQYPDDFTLALDPGSGYRLEGLSLVPDGSLDPIQVPARIFDGQDWSATYLVTLAVLPAQPQANPDAFEVWENIANLLEVLDNDDLSGGFLTNSIEIVDGPQVGRAVPEGNGTIVYEGPVGYVGPDQFSYRFRNSAGTYSTIATVELEVVPRIPGPRFSQFLLAHHDSNRNGQIDIEELAAIQSLDLRNQSIRDLTGIHHMTQLEYLDARNNQIAVIPGMSHLSSLRTLLLDHNRLKTLDNAFTGFAKQAQPLPSNLEQLSLAENQFAELPATDNLAQLQSLNVSNNRLASMGDLSHLDQVKQLNISGNRLAEMPSLPAQVEEVSFAGNPIGDIDFTQFESLKRLDLCNSGITDLAGMEHLRQLEYLDLSYNRIRDITPLLDSQRGNSSPGRVFDLSHNLLGVDQCEALLELAPVQVEYANQGNFSVEWTRLPLWESRNNWLETWVELISQDQFLPDLDCEP